MTPAIYVSICALLIVAVKGINIARVDLDQELIIYINGVPLMAGRSLNLPAYQQLWNVITPQGDRIPASVLYFRGYGGHQLRILNQPGVFHMRIAVVRGGTGPPNSNLVRETTPASDRQVVSETAAPATSTEQSASSSASTTLGTVATMEASSAPVTESLPASETPSEAESVSPTSSESPSTGDVTPSADSPSL